MNVSAHPRHRIYTRGGDGGETTLYVGPRVAKDQSRITVCGEIDELSSALGVARAEGLDPKHDSIIYRIQTELVGFSSEVVCLTPVRCGTVKLDRGHVRQLETDIDEMDTFLSPSSGFIIPGAGKTSAYLHLARSICRRAERSLVTLIRKEPEVSQILLSYLNRLSDLLFVMARREETREDET